MREKILQLGVCFAIFGFCLYSYLDEQNALVQLKMKLPQKEKSIQNLLEEKRRLSYQVDQFESPTHLIELAHQDEFRHLKHPPLQDVMTVPKAFAVHNP